MEKYASDLTTHKTNLDFEEQLERFAVRSNKKRVRDCLSKSRNYKNETDVIPLLIEDIHQLNLPDRSFAETIYAYGIPFACAMIYGRISSNGASANGKIRYCLDDGTGLIQVRLIKHNALKELHHIDLQCYRTFGNNNELYNSVQNILKTTRRQLLDLGSLKFGTKALLIGRPHRLYDKVVFSVFEMIIETQNCNDFEISVKNFIIDWYTKYYKSHLLKEAPMHN